MINMVQYTKVICVRTGKHMPDSDIIAAHAHCINNRKELQESKKCGCFYCLHIFAPGEIETWIRDASGTAICPYCGIDSVIGEASGYPVKEEFLRKMRDYWFGDA